MISLSEEQKALFYTGGNFKDYVFYFPDIDLTITNETIHQEAVTIKEAICEEEELELGGCIASSIEFEVSEIITQDLTGLEFTATLYVNLEDDGTYDLKLPMGVYRVDSAKMVDDKDYKKVVAYDALYDASVDASDWYNRLLPGGDSTTSVKEMRESLLIYLDIPFVPQKLVNDNVRISKTVRAELGSLPAIIALKALCEINGGFGRINRQGKFEVSYLGNFGLFPEDAMGEKGNIYPEETLYPEDSFLYLGVSDEMNDYPEYRTTKYEEYETYPITCLVIQTDEEDEGVTIGNNTENPYFLTGNFLLWGKSISELNQIGQGIFNRLEGIYYRPNTTELDGLPYIQTGDTFALEKRNDVVESYILSRTLSGVQGLRDTYEAKGGQIRTNEISKAAEMQQMKGRTLKLQKSIDGISAELADIEEGTNSRFEMTNQKIETEVKRAKDAEGTLSTQITQTAEGITTTVTKTYETKENAQTTKNQLSSSINQLSNQISLKVTADDVESIIEQNADSIRLKADKISWESRYSSMSESGILKCSSAEIKGTLKCGSDDGYWSFLNGWGEWSGGYGGSTYGNVNYAAAFTNLDTGRTMYGIQMKSEVINLRADKIAAAESSSDNATSWFGGSGSLMVKILRSNGSEQWGELHFTNGILTTELSYIS